MDGLYKEANKYFAASNSAEGFVSYFNEIFGQEECDRLYILKGGPGVGKSTFMKKLAAACRENGLCTECFYCSSDPLSLDGIIIKEKRIAVVDGTNPHVIEPAIAGVREVIIDLGRAWDLDKLRQHKDEILSLYNTKQQHYRQCYSFLYSKSVMDGLVYNLVFPNILFSKLDISAARLAGNLCTGSCKKTTPSSKIRLTQAFSSLGKIRFSTFEDMSDYCIFLKEPFAASGVPGIFMRKIHEHMTSLGADSYVSLNPENKNQTDALFFPGLSVSISLYDEALVADCDRKFKKCRIINTSRFLDCRALSKTKPLRKFYLRLSRNIEELALDALKKAGELHAETEKIYRACTNYGTVEKITNDYINLILNS